MKDVRVVVATHKSYSMPQDNFYLPLQVGVAVNGNLTSYEKDNTGDNISRKNPEFSELTGLYWAWKNLRNDYIGLAHYRRLFKIDSEQISRLLERHKIILPKKRHYFIENLYSHYAHTLYPEPLEMTGEIIKNKYPKYYPEFEKLKTRRSAHMFNMMVMDKETYNKYCSWLFDILFMLEKECANLNYDKFHARFYGRVSELLLDVYLRTEKLEYTEVPIKTTEKTNWLKKGGGFLSAKFFGRKYEKSF